MVKFIICRDNGLSSVAKTLFFYIKRFIEVNLKQLAIWGKLGNQLVPDETDLSHGLDKKV